MSVPKLGLHRGTYVAISNEGGKRVRRSLGTNDEGEAKRRLAHLALSVAILDREIEKTVSELCTLYAAEKAQEGKSVTRLLAAFLNLSPVFGHLYPAYVTPALVKAYTADTKVSRGTVHLELSYLRTVLRWAYQNQFTKKEIFVSLPPKPAPRSDYVSKEQFQTLLSATNYPHLTLFMILAVSTGARSNAILDLTWDRINFERRLIDLRNPEIHETAKGRAVVPITDTAYRYLLEAKKGATTRFVVEYAGSPIKHIRYAMERISERAGLKVTAHMFRHSAAVWMAEGGTPMREIAQFLGHSNTTVTERIYARYSPDYLRNAARHLEL
jgi:integrase